MDEDNETFAWGGVITLIFVAAVLALSGCATKDAPVTVVSSPIADCANVLVMGEF